MITPIDANTFVTSNDNDSLAVWTASGATFFPTATVVYDPAIGIADSGAVVSAQKEHWLITGHEQGQVGIWKLRPGMITFVKAVSVRSPSPIPSPYRLWNVRGIASWKDSRAATGSEDGDLTILSIPDGAILARERYNPSALRGINAITISGDLLLVANCSVGSADRNLWLFRLANDKITPLDSAELQQAAGLPQVFDFSTSFVTYKALPYFVASTQEGLLWLGKVEGDKLRVLSKMTVAPDGGAAVKRRPINADSGGSRV